MFEQPLFRDRLQAGHQLAQRLKELPGVDSEALVLALPRGGAPVAFVVADELDADLDVFLVRKLGAPGRAELAMGAIASGGVQVLNDVVVEQLGLSQADIDRAAGRERREIERREKLYRENRPALPIEGRTVILVDDGLATGASMRAAIEGVQAHKPKRVIAAVPVSSAATCEELRPHVDLMVCAETPEPFQAVGLWYEDFSQTTDGEVRDYLQRARQRASREA